MENGKPGSVRLFTVGNGFTLSRLVLLPIAISGIALDMGYLAVAGMALALISDLLDGRISRRLGTASDFGKNLDSTVDFVLLYSLFITFYAAGRLATYQFAVIYLAMLATLTLQLLSSGVKSDNAVIRTTFGKPAGALQYTYLLILVAREVAPRQTVLALVGSVLFGILAAAIGLYVIECVVRVRKLIASPGRDPS
ncbi:MAG: hypothetical protein A2Z18_03955 [Armatimonadetes bacterium RBG_16_58_9]|nr:MAG: hypothetical protein A2Z18_03955 [Armatimonadetes bacterium RBG_16_58_9]